MNTFMSFVKILIVLLVAENIKAITVKPCPTNKIAPHRRSPRFNRVQTRTFGHFYSLLVEDDQGGVGGLQEEPQADDPNDCGDIEDYDENDLSSVTRNEQRKRASKFFLPNPFGFLYQYTKKPITVYTTTRPEKPGYQSTRPPPGGYFGTNSYRPQVQLNPSDHLKPVQEYPGQEQMPYRPSLVGAPLGHVVGVHQINPSSHFSSQNKQHHKTHPITEPVKHNLHKHPKPRNIQENGLLRSFIDLIF